MRGFAEATINIRALEVNASFHTIDRNLKFHLQVSLKSEGIIVLQDNLHFVKPVFPWDHVIKITCEPSLSLPEPRSRSQSQSAEATPPIAVYSKIYNFNGSFVQMAPNWTVHVFWSSATNLPVVT